MDGPVELTGRALHELAETVALIEPGQWESPTPCDLWTVRELLEHIVAVNRKYEHIPSGDPWLPGLKAVDLGDDPARTYRSTIAPFLTAWGLSGVLNQTILTQGDRRVPAEVVLLAHLRETLVHGWDLAVSIGRAAPFDDAVVEACLQSVARTPEVHPSGISYAGTVTAPAGSSPIGQLAAFYGRDVTLWAR
jgi:uncharacterized protein (TIGR03086 family)